MNKHVYVKVRVEVVGNHYDDSEQVNVTVWGLVTRLPHDAVQMEAHRWASMGGGEVFHYHGPVAVPD